MAHKLKIVLKHTKPEVYRTVIVPEKFTFHDLHITIQCVMEWQNAHLYQFNLGPAYASDRITLIDEDDGYGDFEVSRFEKMDSTKTYLAEYLNGKYKKLNYIYDFGDDWHHEIRVLQKPTEEVIYPMCIKGDNAAPMEDCGSYPGFYNLIEISNKSKKTSKEKELLNWYGVPTNMKYEDCFAFDIEITNELLMSNFRK